MTPEEQIIKNTALLLDKTYQTLSSPPKVEDSKPIDNHYSIGILSLPAKSAEWIIAKRSNPKLLISI